MTDQFKENLHFESDRFDVIDLGKFTGIDYKKITIGVLPYSMKDGIVDKVGLLNESNVFRDGGFSNTIITGTMEPSDKSLLDCSIRELCEESGYTIESPDSWNFLGAFSLSKGSNEINHVFAVDVTGSVMGKAKGDGSKKEELSTFKMMDVVNVIQSNEALLLASYIRLFNFLYNKYE